MVYYNSWFLSEIWESMQKEKKNVVAFTEAEREGLRRANQATAKLLQNLATLARPGVTTGDLNDYAMDYMTLSRMMLDKGGQSL